MSDLSVWSRKKGNETETNFKAYLVFLMMCYCIQTQSFLLSFVCHVASQGKWPGAGAHCIRASVGAHRAASTAGGSGIFLKLDICQNIELL